MIKHLEKEEDFSKSLSSELTLVDFYADWCGPCKALGPIIDALEDVNVVKVNVDIFGDLAASFGIMSIPTLILFKDGEVVDKKVGLISRIELNEWIKKNK